MDKTKPDRIPITVLQTTITLTLTSAELQGLMEGSYSITLASDGEEIALYRTTDTVIGKPLSCRTTVTDSSVAQLPQGELPLRVSTPKPLQASSSSSTGLKSPVMVKSSTEPPVMVGTKVLKGKKKKKKNNKGPSVPTNPLTKVESRLKRCVLWSESVPVERQLSSLNPALAEAITSQTYVWKEYAIANRLRGYEDSATARDAARSADPGHQSSSARKLARRSASSNAGKCLRQPAAINSSQEDSKAKVSEIEAGGKVVTIPEEAAEEEEKEKSLSYDGEVSFDSSKATTAQSSLQKKTPPTAPPRSKSQKTKGKGDPAKDPRILLSKGHGRKRSGSCSGRKSWSS
jgi:hypothetical protein